MSEYTSRHRTSYTTHHPSTLHFPTSPLFYLKWLLLAPIILVVVYLLLAALLSWIGTGPRAKTLVGEVTTIYLHSNGVHTDFILPRAAVPERLIDLLRGADRGHLPGVRLGR